MTRESTTHPRPTEGRVAIIVGVLLAGEDDTLADDLAELTQLLATLKIQVGGRVVQKRQKVTPRFFVGEGKVDDIKLLAEQLGSKLVIFDRTLSGPQVRNLEEATGCEVQDRTGVILEIFARHARTTQAKTQVEIARLEYMMPRMTGAWSHLERQRGGGVQRGMGEKQIEVDRRLARERMSRLRRQLEGIQKDRQNQRKARLSELKVALVGYTNSGKTSIMSAVTRANVQAEDVLFATLDASVRTLDPSTRPKILLSDTVGFIRNLPHALVESFKSTLDEVLEADLLLHVVDASHPNFRAQMQTTADVLREIGAGDIPTLMVFNKLDKVADPVLPKILKAAYKNSEFVSALRDDDMVRLRRYIIKYFEENLVRATIEVPADDQSLLSLIYKSCLILETDFSIQDLARFEVRASPAVLAKLHSHVVSVAEGPFQGLRFKD
ncbi:MAG: GTPase HflX [Deltaproteobacteria bacterium]|nr:GTPase HflX [Deltaproteobacteria bacterium]